MKKIVFYFLTGLLIIQLGACTDMMDTDSKLIIPEDERELKDPTDAYHAIAGVLAEMQKIGDKYVLLGELRGDLMVTGEDASVSLKEVNEFEVSADNEYINKTDYYTIINNCNILLERIDTTLTVYTEKVMMPAFAEIKVIRAWTYLQLGLTYGKATYFDQPLLSLESTLGQYQELGLDNLIEVLIQDLEPYASVFYPSGSSVPSTFMPAALLLGDLYLYKERYAQAARMYYQVMAMQAYPITISDTYINRYGNGQQIAMANHPYSYLSEALTVLSYRSGARYLHSKLVNYSLNDKPAILPADNYINFMNNRSYYHLSGTLVTERDGSDLRGNMNGTNGLQVGDAYFNTDINNGLDNVSLIFKYFYISNYDGSGSAPDNNLLNTGFRYSPDGNGWTIATGLYYLSDIPLYRYPHLYLRYAQAVNRAGKPTLAFAVLKHGLTEANLNNPNKINPGELGEDYTNFQGFTNNAAMAERGRGAGVSNLNYYLIPDFTRYVGTEIDEEGNEIKIPSQNETDILAAKQDSIDWVELELLDELAAETPFEGNRFFDLLMVSQRRAHHPEFMAEKVAAKYDNPASMKTKLMDLNKWFLP